MATPLSPSWASGLVKNGSYFEGLVDNLDVLELHKRETDNVGNQKIKCQGKLDGQ